MTKSKSTPQEGISEAIRAEIAKIPASELCYAKPSRVLPCLEAAGIEITPSVRSATSKLLAMAKKTAGISKEGEVITFYPASIEGQESTGRRELAMRLVEACGGNFELVRAEIARLEQFVRSIKGA
jgi:hypothetical protein